MAHHRRSALIFIWLVLFYPFLHQAVSAASPQIDNGLESGSHRSADFAVIKQRARRPVPSLKDLGCTVAPSSNRYFKIRHSTGKKLDFLMDARVDDDTGTLYLNNVQQSYYPGGQRPFRARDAFVAFWKHSTTKPLDSLREIAYMSVNTGDTIGAIAHVQQTWNPNCSSDGMCTVTREDEEPFTFLLNNTSHAKSASYIPYEFDELAWLYVTALDWGDPRIVKEVWFRIVYDVPTSQKGK